MSKKLLILERSKYDLSTTKESDGSVVLEGVFTEIGVKNKNNRIYEEQEVLPHIKELQEKVKTSKLLGELDHPKDFDISLANVSHVIEDLHYDPSKKQVLGRIRLLNTSKGKEAQALVNDGIPLHISSRAAGNVDESGRVKIKKFFTYDLVADPGFANAELSRVNESYGFDEDETLFIYEMEDKENKKENNEPMEENKNFVTAEDFNKYTEYLKTELKGIKEASNSSEKELLEKLIKYTETIGEKVNQLADYTEYLSENLDKSIAHTDYVVENVNNIKNYTKYLAEELDNNVRYVEHVAEMADKGIQYTEHVAEKADQGILYTQHVAEKADQGIRFANYLSEKLEQTVGYAEHIAEKADQTIQYTEYLKEGIENSISYAEHIAESVNSGLENPINESTATTTEDEVINEAAKVEESVNTAQDRVNALLESVKAKAVVPKGDHHFMNFLTESRKAEFSSLNEDAQTKLVENMNKSLVMSSIQAENVWESTFKPQRTTLNFIEDMPEKFQEKWNNLSEARQSQIIAESKFHPLNTQYQINNFWQTRDLRSQQVNAEALTESKTAAELEKTQEPLVNESFAADIVARVKHNLGRN
jgi:hypothetical protein